MQEEGKKGRLFTDEDRRKAQVSLREKLGPEGYSVHMAIIGARGGKARVPKGFAMRQKGPAAQELHKGPQPGRGNEDDQTTN